MLQALNGHTRASQMRLMAQRSWVISLSLSLSVCRSGLCVVKSFVSAAGLQAVRSSADLVQCLRTRGLSCTCLSTHLSLMGIN